METVICKSKKQKVIDMLVKNIGGKYSELQVIIHFGISVDKQYYMIGNTGFTKVKLV